MNFDVLMPSLNSGSTIRKSLESLLEQKLLLDDRVVIHILDGGSSDNTHEIVSSVAHSLESDGFSILFHQKPDNGLYFALNNGISVARGDVLFFLNADDCLHGDDIFVKLGKGYRSGWGVCFPKVVAQRNNEPSFTYPCFCSLNSLYRGRIPVHPGFSMLRRYADDIRFNTKYKICADIDFILNVLIKNNPVIGACDSEVQYFLGGISSPYTARGALRNFFENFSIYTKIFGSILGIYFIVIRYIRRVVLL